MPSSARSQGGSNHDIGNVNDNRKDSYHAAGMLVGSSGYGSLEPTPNPTIIVNPRGWGVALSSEAPSSTSIVWAATATCNSSEDQTPCGDLCCSIGYYCLETGQCTLRPTIVAPIAGTPISHAVQISTSLARSNSLLSSISLSTTPIPHSTASALSPSHAIPSNGTTVAGKHTTGLSRGAIVVIVIGVIATSLLLGYIYAAIRIAHEMFMLKRSPNTKAAPTNPRRQRRPAQTSGKRWSSPSSYFPWRSLSFSSGRRTAFRTEQWIEQIVPDPPPVLPPLFESTTLRPDRQDYVVNAEYDSPPSPPPRVQMKLPPLDRDLREYRMERAAQPFKPLPFRRYNPELWIEREPEPEVERPSPPLRETHDSRIGRETRRSSGRRRLPELRNIRRSFSDQPERQLWNPSEKENIFINGSRYIPGDRHAPVYETPESPQRERQAPDLPKDHGIIFQKIPSNPPPPARSEVPRHYERKEAKRRSRSFEVSTTSNLNNTYQPDNNDHEAFNPPQTTYQREAIMFQYVKSRAGDGQHKTLGQPQNDNNQPRRNEIPRPRSVPDRTKSRESYSSLNTSAQALRATRPSPNSTIPNSSRRSNATTAIPLEDSRLGPLSPLSSHRLPTQNQSVNYEYERRETTRRRREVARRTRQSLAAVGAVGLAAVPVSHARRRRRKSSPEKPTSRALVLQTRRLSSLPSTPIEPPILESLDLIRRECHWNIDHTSYSSAIEVPLDTVKTLGHGSMGVVDEVRARPPGQTFIRKRVRILKHNARRDRAIIQAEIRTLRRLAHPHMVKLFGSYEEAPSTGPDSYALLMYPVGDGNLKDYLDSLEGHSPDSAVNRRIQNYLHSQRIHHQDIKHENIIYRTTHIFITDFGSARQLELGQITSTSDHARATERYAAPEIVHRLQNSGVSISISKHGSKSDVFSLGCVFLELLGCVFLELLVAESGRSLRDFYAYCVSRNTQIVRHGDSQPTTNNLRDRLVYCNVLAPVNGYFASLEERYRALYDGCVKPMLAVEREARPSAEEVGERLGSLQPWGRQECVCRGGRG
ncbi:kinase-like protein [Mytilinidion resinicola]|uniref:Kinase-like protein n=1 Tax=Mytilinidion resinicola TaxID=574789 RepID=A0A6A6YZZ2_9PEZI|nr:kinase-like protein [Mytilinidion resinicola]KAF2814098.1 kinase-like protein [Mytilinidion resinicola]